MTYQDCSGIIIVLPYDSSITLSDHTFPLLQSQADVKAHDKEVVGLVLACSQEDPEQPRLTLYTAGMEEAGMGEVGIEVAGMG